MSGIAARAGCAIDVPEQLFPVRMFSIETRRDDDAVPARHPMRQALIQQESVQQDVIQQDLVEQDLIEHDLIEHDLIEQAIVAGAVPKRRAQFAAGRHCAHRALSRLQVARAPLLRDAHGAPTWPVGTVGSISHTQGLAICVAARRAQVLGVGVDVDRWRDPFPMAALSHICVERERDVVASLPDIDRPLHLYALFSIKESIYKCVYAASGERLRFHDACIAMDLRRGLYFAKLDRSPIPGRNEIVGRVGCDDHFVFSSAWWFAEPIGRSHPRTVFD